MKRFFLAAIFGLLGGLPAIAADLPAKARAVQPRTYPATSGWFVGLGIEGGAGSANLSAVAPALAASGVNPNSLTTTTIDAHILAGYAWTMPWGYTELQARVGWQNFNGNSQGFSFSGPLAFEQRFTFGAPVQQILAFFPQIFSGTLPPVFTPPPGTTVTANYWYLGASVDERDISLNFGETANKAWAVAPGLVIGQKNILATSPMASTLMIADVYAKIRFDDKGLCVGSITNNMGCISTGTSYLAGLDLKWGL